MLCRYIVRQDAAGRAEPVIRTREYSLRGSGATARSGARPRCMPGVASRRSGLRAQLRPRLYATSAAARIAYGHVGSRAGRAAADALSDAQEPGVVRSSRWVEVFRSHGSPPVCGDIEFP
jgi:hypothetical protein